MTELNRLKDILFIVVIIKTRCGWVRQKPVKILRNLWEFRCLLPKIPSQTWYTQLEHKTFVRLFMTKGMKASIPILRL